MKRFNLALAIFIIASAQAAEATKGEAHQAVNLTNETMGRNLGSESENELDSTSKRSEERPIRNVIIMRDFIREMSPHR